MPYLLSFISPPASRALDEDLLRRMTSDLPHSAPPVWLAAGEAAEVAFAHDQTALSGILEKARAALGDRPVDLNLLPADGRRKKLLVADMDSTMIAQECIDELADLVGIKEEVSAITERTMRGELDFEPALRARVALLKGITLEEIEALIRDRITLMPGARELVGTMRARGAHTALVSGGFTLFTGPVAEKIGFDEHRSNELILDSGRLAGAVAEPILGREAKREAMIDLRTRLKLRKAETIGVGDGANDLAMLDEAGLGVAFRAKPAVAEAADARIDHGDLTALLYLQGYRREEFAA